MGIGINCGGSVTVSNDAVFPITADATVTWTYEDENGNTTRQTQEVLISAVDATVTVSGATIAANNTNSAVTYQWVDCDDNNSPIAGADQVSFTATANGNYAVEVTEGNCTETSACTEIDLSNVNELTADMIKVYPNSASSLLNIETAAEGTVGFYDVSGKLILTQNVITGSNEMNVDQLATGTYTLRLTSANGIQTVRLVITKKKLLLQEWKEARFRASFLLKTKVSTKKQTHQCTFKSTLLPLNKIHTVNLNYWK